MAGNTRSTLRRTAGGMAAHDRLPVELRRWAAEAPLPFSAASVLRLWTRLLRQTGGDRMRARVALDARAAALVARDAARIWGADYPA